MEIKKANVIIFVLGLFPVSIIGYYLSAFLVTDQKNTVYTILDRYNVISTNPLKNYWNKYSLLLIVFVWLIYFIVVMYCICGNKPTRNGEENGSSKWENPVKVCKYLADNHNGKTDPLNIIVIKKHKNIFCEIARNLFYKFKYRKAN